MTGSTPPLFGLGSLRSLTLSLLANSLQALQIKIANAYFSMQEVTYLNIL